ncbi:DUF87 domain-containing protein [Coleofasciculus sp. FACHB-SPT9]|uniref:ATP-binding protein n=1 Tax=Cyanophyceae TaxID=3028117 RepID=UPI0016875A5A|nr:DUF87 domain-containing protein [Coleofasciculus sp. FACHB-SPT9]MBD1892958.1 DUF87 domain-containing protein [Coleofasciculus sp. FACHB-SPT9]
MASLIYRVTHLPDLEKTEYHARYGADPASRLFEMQDNFLHTLHTIAKQYPLVCSLIYSFDPNEPNQDSRLQIFVRVNFLVELNSEYLDKVRNVFRGSFWQDFYALEEVFEANSLDTMNFSWVKHISFAVKKEEKVLPTVRRDKSPSHYYLVQPFNPKDNVDRVSLCSKIEAYKSRVFIEVTIQPTTLSSIEQSALENLLRVLSDQASYEVETSPLTGKVKEQPIDPVAERTLRLFEDLREAIQSQQLYETSIKVLAEDQFISSLLLNEFWVESSDTPLYREIGFGCGESLFDEALKSVQDGRLFPKAIWAEYWESLPENSPLLKLQRLHRLMTVEEVSACFRVVVPDPVVVFNGIAKETDLRASNEKANILLGWQSGKSENKALVPLNNLNKHVFICGVPGSGKTTAVLNILFQLWTEHNIPFLVIEPAKTEYRSMLKCTYSESALHKDKDSTTQSYIEARNVPAAIDKIQADLQIFSLGNERVCPFRFNPFAFYGKTTLDEHISTLEACFKGAMPLFGPLPALLAEAIEQVYATFGWQPQDTSDYGLSQNREFPNMQDLYEAVTAILETKQYSSDIMGDIKTALEVRIGGLLRRSVGSMLNTRQSVPDIAQLLQQPVILEMDSLNEEQANLMTMFILATLREYTRVTRKSGSSLKHIVVIEEAHNIVGTDANHQGEEGASNPKAEATKYIVRMLAEMRALGQGIIIADQLPSAVSPEVVKNTNVKLAHRTVSGDDREILQQSMLLTSTQSEELARANPGDAYLFMEGTYKPVRIKEPNTKLIYGIEEPPSNEELVECIEHKAFYQNSLATKHSLFQQKFEQKHRIVKAQFDLLIESFSKTIQAGKSLIEVPLAQQTNLEKLYIVASNLQEFIQGISELLTSVQTDIDKIWNSSRQEGIFDALKADIEIQSCREKLEYCQQALMDLQEQCYEKLEKVKHQVSSIHYVEKLQNSFTKVKELFELYFQKSSEVLTLIEQTKSADEVQASYQEVQQVREIFDARLDEFDQLDSEENLLLSSRLNTAIESMVNQINEIEEKIHSSYRVKYS